jgi:predicted aspartyl protease
MSAAIPGVCESRDVMKILEKSKVGRITVEFEIANNQDLARARHGDIDPSKVRRAALRGVVDSGAARLVLPQSVVEELGLPIKKKKIKVRYADGRRGMRVEVDDVRLFLLKRDGVFSAIVEPKRDTALIGAIVLEDLDLLVDCAKLRLVPRDPDFVVSEIE